MLSRGAFADVGALEAKGAIYLKLGGAEGGFKRELISRTRHSRRSPRVTS